MKNIFVSYTTKDKKVADDLVRYIEGKGISCFIAPRDIDPGKPYASNLMSAIEQSQVVLLIASEAINSSEHVLNEIDAIVDKRKTILPVFIEDFQLNNDYKYYLGRKQWVIAYPDSPSSYFDKILEAVLPFVKTEKKIETKKVEPSRIQQFEYIPDRGIMINPEDHQRNVSFRTDTFINMMGGIYDNVAAIAGPEKAEEIFYDSGYVSGKNFAERINNQWNTGYTLESMRERLEKWCHFDSAVGWGLFSSDISLDEENDELTGKITISEPFIVDNAKKRKICAFIRGYCEGVVSILLNSTEVEFTCAECPLKSKFKCQCVFNIKI